MSFDWLPPSCRTTAVRHTSAFAGASDYTPLGLSLRNRFSINRFEFFDDLEAMFANELAKAEAQAAIGSDIVPCLVVRHDPVVLPCLFGGEVVDVGGRPMIEPFLDGLDAAARLEIPPLEAGITPQVIAAFDHFLMRAPEGTVVCKPPQLDPFDAALLMFGSDLLFEMKEHPEEIMQFLKILTEAFIEVEQLFKRRLGEPDKESVTYLGTCVRGVRVAADSLVNLSPAMIRHFCFPIFDRLAEVFGGVLVHYCPSPNLKYYHVLTTLIESSSVLGVDTSGGIEYFDHDENPVRLDGRQTLIADCAIRRRKESAVQEDKHPNINRFAVRYWDGLREWVDGGFMSTHRRKGHGIILRATVDSIEEGKELYAQWKGLFPAAPSLRRQ